MTALRTMLADWRPPHFASLEPSAIPLADDGDTRGRDRVAESRRALEDAFAAGDLTDLPRFALSYGLQSADDPAAGGEAGFASLIAEAERRADRSSARAVLRALLDGFDPDAPRTAALAGALRTLAPRLPPDMGRLTRLLKLAKPPRAVVTVAGLLGTDRNGLRFARPSVLRTPLGAHAIARVIEATVTGAASAEPKATLEELIALGSLDDGTLSPRLRALLYPALVRPFLDGTPDAAWRNPVKELVLGAHGGPRLPATVRPRLHRDHDGSLASRCVALVRRWLAVDTFRLFIAVIDRTGVDDQWRARRDFWMRYFETEAVTDVRAIFAGEADRVARHVRAQPGNRAMTWAKLGQAQPNHSVLLMQIGPLRIAEWSHSGRVRFWLPQARPQPRMNAGEYVGPELRDGSIPVWHPDQNAMVDGFVHHANGRWRSYTAAVIAKHAGVRP